MNTHQRYVSTVGGKKAAGAQPFTVSHICSWAKHLVLDNGKPWTLEPFQRAFLADVFAGFLEALLVIPEGNAKTTLIAGLVLYHLEFIEYARATVAAASRYQAGWLFQAMRGFVERSDLRQFRVQEGHLRILCDGQGSRAQVYAADDRTGDGAIPTFAVLEELHRHRNLNLYRTWRGKLEKRGGQLVAISTAGEPDGEFEALRKAMRDRGKITRDGAFVRAVGPHSVLHEFSLPEDGDPDDLRQVKAANPLKAVTIASLKRKRTSPAFEPTHWRRFVCGVPTAIGSAIGPERWDPLRADIGTVRQGEQVWLGIRTGQEGGSGIGIVALRADGSVAVAIERHSYAWPELVAALRRLMEIYDVREIYIDERQFGIGAQVLDQSGLPLANVYQSPVALMEATATFIGLVGSAKVIHDGDDELRRQVLGAQVKESTTGAYFQPVADQNAFIGLIMAVHQAAEHAGDRSPKIHVYRGA